MDATAFPQEIRAIVDEFDTKSATTTLLRTEFRGGKSGAFVGLVDCQGAHDGVFVMKVASRAKGEQEALQHQRALSIAAFQNKIPSLVDTFKTDTLFLLLFKLAGGSRITWRPLVESLHLLASGYSVLATTLWSPTLLSVAEQLQSGSLLPQMLGQRLAPTSGRIYHHARAFLGQDVVAAHAFHHLGQVLPNPLQFSLDPARYNTPLLRPLVGPHHGDCHAANVIVATGLDGSVRDLALIDLVYFAEREPFFYDTSYFEVAMLLPQMNDLGQDRWFRLASVLASSRESDLGTLDQFERAWAADLFCARKTTATLIDHAYPDRKDDFALQILLTHVAAGLAFINKKPRQQSGSLGLSESQYREAFIWAALHLREFFKLTDVDWLPSRAHIPTLGLQSAVVSIPQVAEWRDLVNFDQFGFNILVLSPLSRSTKQEVIQELMRLPWNLVIDLGTDGLSPEHSAAPGRSLRQVWPKGPEKDPSTLTRSTLWYFANGRLDISEAHPAQSAREWRQTYLPQLQDLLRLVAQRNAPSLVRTLVVGDDLPQDFFRQVAESLDSYLGHVAVPILVTGANIELLPDVPMALVPLPRFLDVLRAVQGPAAAEAQGRILLPHRGDGGPELREVASDLIRRLEKDLAVVHRALANSFPADRKFGTDFRRGGLIEWAELDNALDVPRDALSPLLESIRGELAKSTNSTINLVHEPSAGATTLSRRVGWELMQEYPVALISQISPTTAEYLSELGQECGLPVLVIMEAEVVTESRREILFRELLDSNTRAVFLWVSRTYADATHSDVLKAELSDEEAERFQKAYDHDVPMSRADQLVQLTYNPEIREQRSPFFYGLAAFEDGYLGLDRLVADTLHQLDSHGKELVTDLALVSLYSSEGFPASDFDELCTVLHDRARPFRNDSPFAITHGRYVKIPHRLIAVKTLRDLARVAEQWKADLGKWANTLLGHLRRLKRGEADPIKDMVTSLFVTRDTAAILGADSDIAAGGIPRQRRFAPLIHDIGSVEISRSVLRRLYNDWPNEPHFAVHYARHLLYEEPRDIDTAEKAVATSYRGAGRGDDTVVHTLGMCRRVRMGIALEGAKEQHRAFVDVEAQLQSDSIAALQYFAEASTLDPASEYGHLSSIQTVSTLLRGAAELSNKDLAELLKEPQHRWLVATLARAEDSINMLRSRPGSHISIRARKTLAQWALVYGNLDKVISQLRVLTNSYEDAGVRRALCSALLMKHKRNWRGIPDADLQTITMLMERNIGSAEFTDSDLSRWLRAYRMRRTFDIERAIERLIDWNKLRPDAVEPAFYLYVFYFVKWLTSQRTNRGYINAVQTWLNVCRENRPLGEKRWSYEWLVGSGKQFSTVYFGDMDFDPVQILTGRAPEKKEKLDLLGRVEGTLTRYIGRQHAVVDLGQGFKVHITPRGQIVKEDEGRRIRTFISFSYDGPIGWDPLLV